MWQGLARSPIYETSSRALTHRARTPIPQAVLSHHAHQRLGEMSIAFGPLTVDEQIRGLNLGGHNASSTRKEVRNL